MKKVLTAFVLGLSLVFLLIGCGKIVDDAKTSDKEISFDSKAIYSLETNGVKNSQLIGIAREFIKSNPREIYRGDRKFTEKEYKSDGKNWFSNVLTNDPSNVNFLKDQNKYIVTWQTCWGAELDEQGYCKEPQFIIDIKINNDFKAESASSHSFL